MVVSLLNNYAENSSYGVFCNIDGKDLLVKSGNYKGITLDRRNFTKDGVITFQVKISNNINKIISVYSIIVADFVLRGHVPSKVLENAWTQSGFSGYRNDITPTKKKKLFLERDQNPFSFQKDYGYLDNSMVSEWYTQLVGDGWSLVIGAVTTKDQFTQIFLKKEDGGIRVRITCQLDEMKLLPSERVSSEKIAFIYGKKEDSLSVFADLLSENNSGYKIKKPIKGLCCAYYFQGNKVNEKYILDQLTAIDKRGLKFDIVQIDGVPTPWGDWPEAVEKHFPKGLPFIVQEIKKQGMMAGIWLAPFVASPDSEIFKNHPDWFLKDKRGKYFEARLTSPFDFSPFLSLRALDPTHPEFQEHLTKTIKKIVGYGFEYIKTDFTYPVCFSNNYHVPMTRVQALRLGFETIKKAAGKDVLIGSAITQISPLVGLIDYCRVGLDTLNPSICKIPIVNSVVNNGMLRENLRSCGTRNFLHNKIWVNDPDCIIFRPGTGLEENLIEKQKRFALNNKTSLWTGDNLDKINIEELKDLLK